jgi:hypothetical protein
MENRKSSIFYWAILLQCDLCRHLFTIHIWKRWRNNCWKGDKLRWIGFHACYLIFTSRASISLCVYRRREFTRLEDFHLFISSWNVNRSFLEPESLEPWISCAFRKPVHHACPFCIYHIDLFLLENNFMPDILAIGLQEVAGFSPDQVFTRDDSIGRAFTILMKKYYIFS